MSHRNSRRRSLATLTALALVTTGLVTAPPRTARSPRRLRRHQRGLWRRRQLGRHVHARLRGAGQHGRRTRGPGGWTLQYASSAGVFNSNNAHALSGTIEPGDHFLVQQAQGTGGTTPLPTPMTSGTSR
ncbi:hypothetical protein [Microbacterium sp. NIBRBAC000506063]|uniref:hypothetical protein n=1 Tax=Microbacterium sp. NIBRBAC000506063 TaxID=2734618 RepID=UPI001CB718CB|nr:hypothetical protein [Microbacterium sp. NIBRBAC000506063]